MTSLFLTYIYYYKTDYISFFDIKEAVFYVQKMSLSLMFFDVLLLFKDKNIKFLDVLASHSFGIYFLHTIMDVTYLKLLFFEGMVGKDTYFLFLFVLIYVGLVFTCTVLFSVSAKYVLGKKSRFFIGS